MQIATSAYDVNRYMPNCDDFLALLSHGVQFQPTMCELSLHLLPGEAISTVSWHKMFCITEKIYKNTEDYSCTDSFYRVNQHTTSLLINRSSKNPTAVYGLNC